MKSIYEKVKELRIQQHLSQDYVSNYLGINRPAYTQIENGNRSIKSDELKKLSILYGVSADFLLSQTEVSEPAKMFARSFDQLDEIDQAEIMNLIRFKEQMKANRAK